MRLRNRLRKYSQKKLFEIYASPEQIKTLFGNKIALIVFRKTRFTTDLLCKGYVVVSHNNLLTDKPLQTCIK